MKYNQISFGVFTVPFEIMVPFIEIYTLDKSLTNSQHCRDQSLIYCYESFFMVETWLFVCFVVDIHVFIMCIMN